MTKWQFLLAIFLGKAGILLAKRFFVKTFLFVFTPAKAQVFSGKKVFFQFAEKLRGSGAETFVKISFLMYFMRAQKINMADLKIAEKLREPPHKFSAPASNHMLIITKANRHIRVSAWSNSSFTL